MNEYELMKIMCNKTPDCVVDPLACWDVEHNGQKAKLLVTKWSKADEQFGNQILGYNRIVALCRFVRHSID